MWGGGGGGEWGGGGERDRERALREEKEVGRGRTRKGGRERDGERAQREEKGREVRGDGDREKVKRIGKKDMERAQAGKDGN